MFETIFEEDCFGLPELPDFSGTETAGAEEKNRNKNRKRIRIRNERDTEAVGEALARAAACGDVIALIGDLGAGKTTLTKSIARGLGVTEEITSPTFTVVQEYHSGRMPLFHFDLYRVHDPDELFEIGAEEYLFGKGLSVVEWADLSAELIPDDALILTIRYGSAPEERIYEFSRKERER